MAFPSPLCAALYSLEGASKGPPFYLRRLSPMQTAPPRSIAAEHAWGRLAAGLGVAFLLTQLLGGCTPQRGDFYEELATHERVRVEAVGTGAELVRLYAAMRREAATDPLPPLVFQSDSTAPSVLFRRTGSHATLDIIDQERFEQGFRVTEDTQPLN